jgi:hypothetical protein
MSPSTYVPELDSERMLVSTTPMDVANSQTNESRAFGGAASGASAGANVVVVVGCVVVVVAAVVVVVVGCVVVVVAIDVCVVDSVDEAAAASSLPRQAEDTKASATRSKRAGRGMWNMISVGPPCSEEPWDGRREGEAAAGEPAGVRH